MAKTSSIQRNLKRIKLTEKFQKKRNDLKRIIKNKKLPLEDRFAAQLKLAKIPKVLILSETPPAKAKSTSPSRNICTP